MPPPRCVKMADKEVRRRARSLLRKLASPGAYLACGHAITGGAEKVAVMSPRNRFSRPLAYVDARLVDEILARGWLTRTPLDDGLQLSPAGKAWLAGKPDQDDFRAQHQMRARRPFNQDGERVSLVVNASESPLAWLAGRRGSDGAPWLAQPQLDAGERLRRDYETGCLSPSITSNWDFSTPLRSGARRGPPGDCLTASERALAARRRVHRALAAIGPELSSVVLEVCCLSRGLEAAERRLGWPRRSAKLVLKIALDRLADHYGL